MTDRPHEKHYRMGGELVAESGMQEWHNQRGIAWGKTFEGIDPFAVSRMAWPDHLTMHLANEHHIDPGHHKGFEQVAHMKAHTVGHFRSGQEHYHQDPDEPWPG